MDQEPFNLRLRRWAGHGPPPEGQLHTCARPGRSRGKRVPRIEDEVVECWAAGLPGSEPIVIISLLGSKGNGQSEFSYYSFRSELEQPIDRPTFQDWLNNRFGSSRFRLIEHPTVDDKPVPQETLRRVKEQVLAWLNAGHTVVLMDSGGSSRVGQACRFSGFT